MRALLTEEQFWDIVRIIDGPKEDYTAVRYWMASEFSPKQINVFSRMAFSKFEALKTSFSKSIDLLFKKGIFFDEDVLWNIIGSGRATYEKCVNNPTWTLAYLRGDKFHIGKWAECIPDNMTYKELSLSYYKRWAKNCLEILNKLQEFGGLHLDPVLADINVLKLILTKLAKEGDFNTLLSRNKEYNKAVSKIENFLENNKWELPRKVTDEKYWGKFIAPYFSNLLDDITNVSLWLGKGKGKIH